MATLADLLTSKIPPHSLEAERAVLGGMLLDRESLPKAVELLKPADFYKEGHRKIFDSMLALFERNEPVDLLTISEELRRRSELDEVGGPAALGALAEEAATAAHLLSYGAIVREKAVLRDLIRIATEIIGRSYDGRDDVEKVLDDAERLIFQISERRMQGTAFPVRSILKGTFEQIEKLYDQKEHITGLATGFSGLDEKTSGFQSSDFIIIAGRPSMGKTAFAMNIAKYAGVRSQRRVLVLSLEMSKEQLVQRLLCAEGRVDSHKVRTGYLDTRDWTSLTNAAGRLAEAPSSTCPWWPSPSSRARWRAARARSPSCPTCASPALSSRTPTSSSFSTCPIGTACSRRRTSTSPRSSSASSGTVPRGRST